MTKPKFQIGDRVRVNELRSYTDGWVTRIVIRTLYNTEIIEYSINGYGAYSEDKLVLFDA